eukprot:m.386506 g.386506  ORF g.386506 m.386506 type:complete len:700 (-) comp16745_c3_seq45:9-2108(-)
MDDDFFKDILTDCNASKDNPYPRTDCKFGHHCRRRILNTYTNNVETLRAQVAAARLHTYRSLPINRIHALMETLEGLGPTITVLQVACCLGAFCWVHGYSNHVLKRARAALREAEQPVDSRSIRTQFNSFRASIVEWGRRNLDSYGCSSPEKTHTIYMGLIHAERDLFPVFYRYIYKCDIPRDPELVQPPSAGYFSTVLKRAFGKNFLKFGGTFHAHWTCSPVTRKCKTCSTLAVKMHSGDDHSRSVAKATYQSHLDLEFQQRVFYKQCIAQSIQAFTSVASLRSSKWETQRLAFGYDAVSKQLTQIPMVPKMVNLYEGGRIKCKVIAVVLHGYRGVDEYTIYVVVPGWVADDANLMITIVQYCVYPKLLEPWIESDLPIPAVISHHSDKGGNMWNACHNLVNSLFSRTEYVGRTIEQNSLVPDHAHTVYDRLLAFMKHHLLADAGTGALTLKKLLSTLDSMKNAEAVFIDRALDWKRWALPHMWSGLENHTEPMHFKCEPNGILYAKMNSTVDTWERIGDIWTTEPDPKGPSLAPHYATIPGHATQHQVEEAQKTAMDGFRKEMSAARSVGKYIRELTPTELRFFGYDGDNAAQQAADDHAFFERLIPDPTDPVAPGHFPLPWPPPYLAKIRRADDHDFEDKAKVVWPEWLTKTRWCRSATMEVTPQQLGPKVELTLDGRLKAASRHIFAAALRQTQL